MANIKKALKQEKRANEILKKKMDSREGAEGKKNGPKDNKSSDMKKALKKERNIRRSLEKKLSSAKKASSGRVDKLEKSMKQLTRSTKSKSLNKKLGRELRSAGVHPAALEDVLSDATKGPEKFTLAADGKLSFIDRRGDTVYTKKGNEITVDRYITRLRGDKPHLFIQATGSGVKVNPTTGAPSSDKKFSSWTTVEKDAYRQEHGDEKFANLVIVNGSKKSKVA